jgi:glycogen(starch) synthase
MRILHLTTEFPPIIYGGLGTAVGGWVTGSARSGVDVGVLLIEGPLADDEHGGNSYGRPHPAPPQPWGETVERGGITFFQASTGDAVQAGLEAVERWQPDIIHLHTAMIWHVAAAIRAETGKPLVYHVHSVDRAEYELGHEPNQWLAQAVEQTEAIRSSDRLIALSESERELLAYYYPDDCDRIRIVGNGIDDSDEAQQAAFAKRHADSPLVLYSGRLVERKGIHELLAAIPDVLDEEPRARFALAGGPPAVEGEEVARQWLPPELDRYRSRIHFTGWLSPRQVEEWYRAADVLVVPSRYEPFGMVILEGMLHGLPIVAASVGGPAEILDDEQTGLLFPPRDAHALAKAVLRLVKSVSLRRRIGTAAAREVRSRWMWPRRVERMRAVYRELSPAC